MKKVVLKNNGAGRWDISTNPRKCVSVYNHLLKLGKKGKGFLLRENKNSFRVSVPSENVIYTVGTDKNHKLKFISRNQAFWLV